MPPKGSKRRLNGSNIATSPLSSPVTPDHNTWPGWCEVESEPAFFNTILSDLGVRGIKVQEVLGLDDELLAILPKPIHAMIFLFKYFETEESSQGASCPKDIWFANQVPEYACASVAMLNIVMNVPKLELGPKLSQFRGFTMPLDPVRRGDAIAEFEFLRTIHNSFARANDMLSIDTNLKEKHLNLLKKQKLEAASNARAAKAAEKAALREASRPAGSAGSRSNPPRKARTTKNVDGSDPLADEGFHFVAFMPINGAVWKMDGMERFPQNLGACSGEQDWLGIVQTELLARVLQYQEGQIEFSLMAVIKDPVIEDQHRLAENIKTLKQIEQRLDKLLPDWGRLDGAGSPTSQTQHITKRYHIRDSEIDSATLSESVATKLETDDAQALLRLRQEILSAQAGCLAAIRDDSQANEADSFAAMHRRFNYSPFVKGWLDALAEADSLLPLMEAQIDAS